MGKRHHYIQELILENWSTNGTQIKCIKFNSDETIEKVPMAISDAFVVSFLYGRSPVFEEILFANDIEDKIKYAIDELREKKSVSDKRIQKYIMYQMCRTKFIIDMCNHNEVTISDICFDEEKARKAGFSKDDVKHLIEDKDGHNIGYKDALEDIILPSIKAIY